MDGATLALVGFAVLFVLLFIRMPVGIAMMLVGTAGIWLIRPQAAVPKLAGEIFGEASNYPLTIIPLFILFIAAQRFLMRGAVVGAVKG